MKMPLFTSKIYRAATGFALLLGTTCALAQTPPERQPHAERPHAAQNPAPRPPQAQRPPVATSRPHDYHPPAQGQAVNRPVQPVPNRTPSNYNNRAGYDRGAYNRPPNTQNNPPVNRPVTAANRP